MKKIEDDVYNFGFILLESLVGPVVTGKGETFLLNEMVIHTLNLLLGCKLVSFTKIWCSFAFISITFTYKMILSNLIFSRLESPILFVIFLFMKLLERGALACRK